MQVSTAALVRYAKIDTYAAEVEEIFAGASSYALHRTEEYRHDGLEVAVRTAERRVEMYRQLGLIRRDVVNLWIPSTVTDRQDYRHDGPPTVNRHHLYIAVTVTVGAVGAKTAKPPMRGRRTR